MSDAKEPHPWAEFLKARRNAIAWLRNEMELGWPDIAQRLSCDADQVFLIVQGCEDEDIAACGDDGTAPSLGTVANAVALSGVADNAVEALGSASAATIADDDEPDALDAKAEGL